MGGDIETAEVDDNETFSLQSAPDGNVEEGTDEVSPPDALIEKSDLQEVDEEEETKRRFSAESDSDRNKRVLSNPKEYSINSYQYFYNSSLKKGQGRQSICKLWRLLVLYKGYLYRRRGDDGHYAPTLNLGASNRLQMLKSC